jgi:hypothetical protein
MKPSTGPRLCALPACGAAFVPPHHRSRYCAPACREAAKAEQLAALNRRNVEKRSGASPHQPRGRGGVYPKA